jgi:hypothetical protein
MKKITFLLKVLFSVIFVIIFTVIFNSIVIPIEGPLNPYVIQTFHNVLLLSCGISTFYTVYLFFCVYLHYKKDLERAKSVNKIKDETITPELLLKLDKLLNFGLLSVILYTLQCYIYDYTFI